MASYWGMDKSGYPGDAAMQTIKQNSPLTFTGFYLGPTTSGNHPDTGWMTKYATLKNQGWSIVPLYLGYQNDHFTTAQGSADADNAIDLAKNHASIPTNTRIYLDVEQGGTLSSAQISYIVGWLKRMISVGTYRAGVYAAYTTSQQIFDAMGSQANTPYVRYWSYYISSSAYQNSTTSGTSSLAAPSPAGSGFANASMWQLTQNTSRTYGTVTINPVDISSSIYSNIGEM